MSADQTIVAFAGRRIDAPGTQPPRFPSEALAAVSTRVETFFDRHAVRTVVGSCACGVDILLLEAAAARGFGTRIILPFSIERFRETSVVDRGAEWGTRYDKLIARATHDGDVLVLPEGQGSEDDAYDRVTLKVIEETQRIAKRLHARTLALAIWDQKARATHDATQDFLNQAKRAKLKTEQLSTLPG
jgi:hypothetical protein